MTTSTKHDREEKSKYINEEEKRRETIQLLQLIGPHSHYYHELGNFLTLFSVVEWLVLDSLRLIAGVDETTFNAMMSGTKVDLALSLIDRVLDSKHVDDPYRDKFSEVKQQLSSINSMRNKILHFGAKPIDGEWLVSNELRSHIEDAVYRIKISPDTLTQMTGGLLHITLFLLAFTGLQMEVATHIKQKFSSFLDKPRGAWKYKQPPQDQMPKRNRRASPRPQQEHEPRQG